MVFYKFWIADGICEKQFIREADDLKTIDGTTYWFHNGKRFEVWGVEKFTGTKNDNRILTKWARGWKNAEQQKNSYS